MRETNFLPAPKLARTFPWVHYWSRRLDAGWTWQAFSSSPPAPTPGWTNTWATLYTLRLTEQTNVMLLQLGQNCFEHHLKYGPGLLCPRGSGPWTGPRAPGMSGAWRTTWRRSRCPSSTTPSHPRSAVMLGVGTSYSNASPWAWRWVQRSAWRPRWWLPSSGWTRTTWGRTKIWQQDSTSSQKSKATRQWSKWNLKDHEACFSGYGTMLIRPTTTWVWTQLRLPG